MSDQIDALAGARAAVRGYVQLVDAATDNTADHDEAEVEAAMEHSLQVCQAFATLAVAEGLEKLARRGLGRG